MKMKNEKYSKLSVETIRKIQSDYFRVDTLEELAILNLEISEIMERCYDKAYARIKT